MSIPSTMIEARWRVARAFHAACETKDLVVDDKAFPTTSAEISQAEAEYAVAVKRGSSSAIAWLDGAARARCERGGS